MSQLLLQDETGRTGFTVARHLGYLVYPAADWPPDSTVRETYRMVIPAHVRPGVYALGLRVGWGSRLGSDSMGRYLLAQMQAELRRLLAESPMDGAIRLAFEREPSYFAALRVQDPHAQVLVGRDAESGEAVGVASRSIRPAFVNGRPRDVGYLGDLRLQQPQLHLVRRPLRQHVALLRTIDSGPFFQKVRGDLVTGIYNNPEVWPLFGYEGESYSKGGYIERGFDDIEWL